MFSSGGGRIDGRIGRIARQAAIWAVAVGILSGGLLLVMRWQGRETQRLHPLAAYLAAKAAVLPRLPAPVERVTMPGYDPRFVQPGAGGEGVYTVRAYALLQRQDFGPPVSVPWVCWVRRKRGGGDAWECGDIRIDGEAPPGH